jgi:hypothetical protein
MLTTLIRLKRVIRSIWTSGEDEGVAIYDNEEEEDEREANKTLFR